ncbi:GCN5 family N-acetyltransferase [Labrys miyagiensis]|uniref:GCN5 family N-acetyltransferase n=1 Tax=Labrys miyagiensis TaxID=346912 RepID=A0ABQ6CBC7_9HYPH|nr:GNAT family N-acetyltransferase [Labrys miyagiensis]GLS17687.1 GCN5 family N-acetyltransferase [Labrys miyagiensis]
MRIRPARPEDCEAVVDMVVDFAALFGVTAGTTAEGLRVEAFGSRPTISLLVAEAPDGTLAGYLVHQDTYSTWRGANGVFVVDLFVKPQWRNDGIGIKLMAEAARQGAAKGARFMRLDISEGNEGGRRFYERYGFRPLDHERFMVLDEPGLRALAG